MGRNGGTFQEETTVREQLSELTRAGMTTCGEGGGRGSGLR